MKRFAVLVTVVVLFAGAAHAQSDTPHPGAPLNLQQLQNVPAPQAAKPKIAAPKKTSSTHRAAPAKRVAKTRPAKPRLTLAQERSRTTALNDLSTHGYNDFHDFRPEGRLFLADVQRGGHDIVVAVDPRTHQVIERP